jgi:PQQ-like domain
MRSSRNSLAAFAISVAPLSRFIFMDPRSRLLVVLLGLMSLLSACGGGDSPAATSPPPQQGPPPPPGTNFTGVLMHHNDQGTTGQNLNETALTPANVNQTTFGKLFSYSLDGQAYAQPLYVANVTIAGGTHNVVYVATEHNSVYAFDADGTVSSPFWSVNFTNSGAGITTVPSTDVGGGGPIIPEVGITSTPVIDGKTGTIYVVVATKENGKYFHKLHALDITNGKERSNSPVTIQASVPGTGAGSSGGQIAFQSLYQLQRSALLLLNGTVYLAFASYNDLGPYHGWILGYDASSLKQTIVWNATPDGQRGGIWMSGASLSADSAGNIFAIVGNGTFDANNSGPDYGDSFVKLAANGGSLSVSDYFTPFDQLNLANNDIDVGSAGFTLLPDQPGTVTHLGISAGKSGKIYLINRDNMGKFQSGSDSQIVQSIVGAIGSAANDNDYSTATYWQGNVYFVGNGDVVRQFQLTNGQLSTTPFAKGSQTYGYPGGNTSVSSNGANGGILWAIEAGGGNMLHAYDATDVSKELYNSNQAGSRDQFGTAVRFTVPTVINGKVYVAGKTQLAAFGLL